MIQGSGFLLQTPRPPFNPPFPLGVRGRGVEGEEGEGETGPEQKIAANYADSAAEDNRKRQADG